MEGLNAENAPDVGKREAKRSLLGRCDDHADSNDGKGRSGLDDDRRDAGIYRGCLWGERLPYGCSHLKETEADHGGDYDIQPHAQRDPWHQKVGSPQKR